jgi:hypothetical protein
MKLKNDIEKVIYLVGGKVPWSIGYRSYRNGTIKNSLQSNFLKYSIENNLPNGYGFGLDERVVEYPWLLWSLPEKAKYILDAGSMLNYKYILESKQLNGKSLLVSNLNPESECHNDESVSYLYGYFGDLRNNLVKDNIFDAIICGSVLEHIGMNNARVYKNGEKFNENRRNDYLDAVKEFRRVFKKGGTCLITVPFGKRKSYGWFQVFDMGMINKVTKIFGYKNSVVNLYKYTGEGWRVSNLAECRDAKYFDIREAKTHFFNRQAAAGSVACIKMIKGEL